MWEVLVRTPRGSYNPRKFSMLLATFFVALFGYILATAPSAHAADATWADDNLAYQGNTYSPVDSDPNFPSDVQASPAIYQYVDTSRTPRLVHFIYFADGVTDAKSEKEATYVRYTLNPPNRYINETNKRSITLTPAATSPDTSDDTFYNECTVEGIGWIVCPVMHGIAEGMDLVYEGIRGFLVVQPISTSVDNPIYRIWTYSRDLANIAFVIGFMVIIYSYLVGGGFNGYEIRKILPRLVIAAVLINVSYIVCSVAVDISNITGYGVNELFESVRDEVLTGSSTTAGINWTSVTAWVLAGGTGAAVGAIVIPGAIGAAGGMWFILAPFLLGAALLVMVTFIILAARQAIIIVLISIAPLAFAAFILPNTEKWFEKWRSVFFTMLLMFPAFGAVFGAAQLAGELIIRTANSIEQIILGLGVMVAPLAITPLLLKLGGGVMNRFGGIVNNPRKGLYDRYKNYNKDRLAEYVAKQNAANANLVAGGGKFKRRQFVRRQAAKSYAKKSFRDEQKKQDEESAANAWHRQTGRYGYDNHEERDGRRNWYGTRADGYGSLDRYKRRNALQHDYTDKHHEEHWQSYLQSSAGTTDRQMLTDTRLMDNRAKIRSGAMEAQDERTFQTALNTDSAYANLRNMKVQTSVDSGVAELQKAAVEAVGQQEFRQTVEASRALSRVVKDTHHSKKQAELYENIVNKAAEKSWNDRVRNDADTQTLYVKAKRNEDGAQLAEQQVKTFVQDIRTKGGDAPNVVAGAVKYADNIQDMVLETDVYKNAEAAAQSKERTNLATAYKASAALRMRAGGIGGEAAANLVYAKAFQTMVNDQVEGTKAEKTILSQIDSDEIFKRMDNPDASVEQLAAYAGTIASRGYHAHHIKLLGKASRMYQEAEASGDEDRQAKIKDMIQQIGSDQSKVAFGVRDFDRTLLSEGRYDANIFKTTRERILTNLSPEVMANMDPDDIHLIYEMHRGGHLTPEQSQKIRDEWEAWQKDPNLKSKIQAKHRNFFDRIKNDDYTSEIGGMKAPIKDKYGLTAADFGDVPRDVEIKNS